MDAVASQSPATLAHCPAGNAAGGRAADLEQPVSAAHTTAPRRQACGAHRMKGLAAGHGLLPGGVDLQRAQLLLGEEVFMQERVLTGDVHGLVALQRGGALAA